MHRVEIAGIEASCLGFGCASLGSRVGAAPGLRALAQAHAQGVTWLDVAPAYGAGQAETLLNGFIADVGRDAVQICTKVGLAPPPQSAAKRMVRSLARPLVSVAGPLRAAIRKTGATSNTRIDLTPELLRTSLEQSLTRLGTDHVEVYALHNARPEDLADGALMETFAALRAEGKARALAVAGGADVARAVLAGGTPIDVVQLAQPAGAEGAALIAKIHGAGLGCISHSVFGVGGALQALTQQISGDEALRARLTEAGYGGAPGEVAARLLLARAFAANAGGVVLASMFSERSRTANIAAAGAPIDPAAQSLCAEIGV